MTETTRTIISRITKLKEVCQSESAATNQPSIEEFALLLSGISACRKTPGIDIHMGYEHLYLCNEEKAEIVRDHLKRIYHIVDRDTLINVCNELYSTDNDLSDFRSFWNESPSFDIGELTQESRDFFESCMEYSRNFDELAGEGGYYAWDCNEIIGLLRVGYAAGLITKDDFWAFVRPMAKNAAQLYKSWREYAAGCLCGCAYFMFREQGCNEEVLNFFDINWNLIDHLLGEDGAWQRNGWYQIPEKDFLIKAEDMKIILDSWKGAEGCLATDRILVDGEKVGYMYREEPDSNHDWDSGWRFTAGDETPEYMDDPDHSGIYALNTICNYDPEITELLDAPFGTAYIRIDGRLVLDEEKEG